MELRIEYHSPYYVISKKHKFLGFIPWWETVLATPDFEYAEKEYMKILETEDERIKELLDLAFKKQE